MPCLLDSAFQRREPPERHEEGQRLTPPPRSGLVFLEIFYGFERSHSGRTTSHGRESVGQRGIGSCEEATGPESTASVEREWKVNMARGGGARRGKRSRSRARFRSRVSESRECAGSAGRRRWHESLRRGDQSRRGARIRRLGALGRIRRAGYIGRRRGRRMLGRHSRVVGHGHGERYRRDEMRGRGDILGAKRGVARSESMPPVRSQLI